MTQPGQECLRSTKILSPGRHFHTENTSQGNVDSFHIFHGIFSIVHPSEVLFWCFLWKTSITHPSIWLRDPINSWNNKALHKKLDRKHFWTLKDSTILFPLQNIAEFPLPDPRLGVKNKPAGKLLRAGIWEKTTMGSRTTRAAWDGASQGKTQRMSWNLGCRILEKGRGCSSQWRSHSQNVTRAQPAPAPWFVSLLCSLL